MTYPIKLSIVKLTTFVISKQIPSNIHWPIKSILQIYLMKSSLSSFKLDDFSYLYPFLSLYTLPYPSPYSYLSSQQLCWYLTRDHHSPSHYTTAIFKSIHSLSIWLFLLVQVSTPYVCIFSILVLYSLSRTFFFKLKNY